MEFSSWLGNFYRDRIVLPFFPHEEMYETEPGRGGVIDFTFPPKRKATVMVRRSPQRADSLFERNSNL